MLQEEAKCDCMKLDLRCIWPMRQMSDIQSIETATRSYIVCDTPTIYPYNDPKHPLMKPGRLTSLYTLYDTIPSVERGWNWFALDKAMCKPTAFDIHA